MCDGQAKFKEMTVYGRSTSHRFFWEIRIGSAKDGNKMVVEGLDGAFGLVQLVITRGCKLVIETSSFNCSHKGFGDFIIVKAEELFGESTLTEVGITFFEGFDKDMVFS